MAAVLFFSFTLSAQKYPESVYTVDGLAIKGYDPVAYFVDQKAMKGVVSLTFDWKGSKWLFATKENLEAFKKEPEKYAPQYGGYCAWGMSNGYKAKVDPMNAWTIHDGKLYLNYNKSIKAKWVPKKEELIKVADKNWMEIE